MTAERTPTEAAPLESRAATPASQPTEGEKRLLARVVRVTVHKSSLSADPPPRDTTLAATRRDPGRSAHTSPRRPDGKQAR
eukprot:869996-Prymnesium_polylepis.1